MDAHKLCEWPGETQRSGNWKSTHSLCQLLNANFCAMCLGLRLANVWTGKSIRIYRRVNGSEVKRPETESLLIAAYYHSTGYTVGTNRNVDLTLIFLFGFFAHNCAVEAGVTMHRLPDGQTGRLTYGHWPTLLLVAVGETFSASRLKVALIGYN